MRSNLITQKAVCKNIGNKSTWTNLRSKVKIQYRMVTQYTYGVRLCNVVQSYWPTLGTRTRSLYERSNVCKIWYYCRYVGMFHTRVFLVTIVMVSLHFIIVRFDRQLLFS